MLLSAISFGEGVMGREMENVDARHCYRILKDCPECKGDVGWLNQLPMILLTGSARAYMYSIYLARGGKFDRAEAFMVLANGLATEEERPYVLHLQSMFAYLSGNTQKALTMALEAREAAGALGDRELQVDVYAHLAEIHRATGDTTTADDYEREADRVRRTLAHRPDVKGVANPRHA